MISSIRSKGEESPNTERKPVASPEPVSECAVGGCKGLHLEGTEREFTWIMEDGIANNARRLGALLASAGDLYRNGTDGHGLLHVLPDGKVHKILKGTDLSPVIVDRVKMWVIKEGKLVSELPADNRLTSMLRTEAFLDQFLSVDEVANHPVYFSDFSLAQPGYNDAGSGQRVLYLGPEPDIADSTATIATFLDAMDFDTAADRTNTVAAALTVLLRRHWEGEKPLVLVTATKSHAGKGTVTESFRGAVPKADILYESHDWPMLNQFQRQLQMNPEVGLLIFDNVRCDSSGGRTKFIRSGFIESFVTSPEITLASPGGGRALHIKNRYVVTINTNDGRLSADLMNRALPIHLSPVGNVEDRDKPIGNPKLEFLPKNRERIEAELHGMIHRWVAAGCPLDDSIRHPMTNWARTIGGILKLAGFQHFLGNLATRKSADDSTREAIGILGAVCPGRALRPRDWAKLAVEHSLAKELISANERDTEKGRERAIGVVLSKHTEETFEARTDTKLYRLELIGGYRRWTPGENPHVRYRFDVLEEKQVAEDIGQTDTNAQPCGGEI